VTNDEKKQSFQMAQDKYLKRIFTKNKSNELVSYNAPVPLVSHHLLLPKLLVVCVLKAALKFQSRPEREFPFPTKLRHDLSRLHRVQETILHRAFTESVSLPVEAPYSAMNHTEIPRAAKMKATPHT
jgi:hypothetical protein